jgi:hypothetical protein
MYNKFAPWRPCEICGKPVPLPYSAHRECAKLEEISRKLYENKIEKEDIAFLLKTLKTYLGIPTKEEKQNDAF